MCFCFPLYKKLKHNSFTQSLKQNADYNITNVINHSQGKKFENSYLSHRVTDSFPGIDFMILILIILLNF